MKNCINGKNSVMSKNKSKTYLAKLFEPSKKRLLNNAFHMMITAEDKWFRDYWSRVYAHLCKQYNNLN
tara:strand:+ start:36 stop:239 length:204 start_codon:yes stop_codon:yes gene_type:complete